MKIRRNNPAEEAAINRGIASDPDSPELTDEFFAAARPAHEMMAPGVYGVLVRRTRGLAKKPAKALVTLRLDREVVEVFRAQGPGWQTRVNQILRKAAGV